MWWLLIIFTFLLLAWVGSFKLPENPNAKYYEITFPNPENVSAKEVLEAIENLAPFQVPEVERGLDSQNIDYNKYKGAFKDKLMNRFNKAKYSHLLDSTEKFSNKTDKENIIFLDLAGCFVRNRRFHLLNTCFLDDEVKLSPEPNNKFDSEAIRVHCNGKLIGYIKADETHLVRDILDEKYFAYLTYIDSDENYISAEIAIEY